jgi:hypothetical protein
MAGPRLAVALITVGYGRFQRRGLRKAPRVPVGFLFVVVVFTGWIRH